MKNKQSVAEKAMVMAGTIYMNSTTKYVKGLQMPNSPSKNYNQNPSLILPTVSHNNSIISPKENKMNPLSPSKVTPTISTGITKNANEVKNHPRVLESKETASKYSSNDHVRNESVQEKAMSITGNIFMNSTTKFMKGFNNLSACKSSDRKQSKSPSPKNKIQIKEASFTQRISNIQKKALDMTGTNYINSTTKYFKGAGVQPLQVKRISPKTQDKVDIVKITRKNEKSERKLIGAGKSIQDMQSLPKSIQIINKQQNKIRSKTEISTLQIQSPNKNINQYPVEEVNNSQIDTGVGKIGRKNNRERELKFSEKKTTKQGQNQKQRVQIKNINNSQPQNQSLGTKQYNLIKRQNFAKEEKKIAPYTYRQPVKQNQKNPIIKNQNKLIQNTKGKNQSDISHQNFYNPYSNRNNNFINSIKNQEQSSSKRTSPNDRFNDKNKSNFENKNIVQKQSNTLKIDPPTAKQILPSPRNSIQSPTNRIQNTSNKLVNIQKSVQEEGVKKQIQRPFTRQNNKNVVNVQSKRIQNVDEKKPTVQKNISLVSNQSKINYEQKNQNQKKSTNLLYYKSEEKSIVNPPLQVSISTKIQLKQSYSTTYLNQNKKNQQKPQMQNRPVAAKSIINSNTIDNRTEVSTIPPTIKSPQKQKMNSPSNFNRNKNIQPESKSIIQNSSKIVVQQKSKPIIFNQNKTQIQKSQKVNENRKQINNYPKSPRNSATTEIDLKKKNSNKQTRVTNESSQPSLIIYPKNEVILKKSNAIFLTINRFYKTTISSSFQIIKKFSLKKQKSLIEAKILCLSIQDIYAAKKYKVTKMAFDNFKVALTNILLSNKSTNDAKENALNGLSLFVQKLFLSKIRNHFKKILKYTNIIASAAKNLFVIETIIKRSEKDKLLQSINQIKVSSKNRYRNIESMVKIISKYNMNKQLIGFKKILLFSIINQKKPVVRQNKSIEYPKTIQKQNSSKINSIQQKEKQLKLNINNVESQISILERKVYDKKRVFDNQKKKLTKQSQQLQKINQESKLQLSMKKDKNKELKKLVNKSTYEIIDDFQIDSISDQESKVKLLTQIYSMAFRNTQEIIQIQSIQVYVPEILPQTDILKQWNTLCKNLKIKQEISNYEGYEPKQNRIRNSLVEESQLVGKLVKNYIRQRYLWQCLKMAASG